MILTRRRIQHDNINSLYHLFNDLQGWVGTKIKIFRIPILAYVYYRYQTELPKKIKARGTDAFLTHDEIVQTIKWKLAVS